MSFFITNWMHFALKVLHFNVDFALCAKLLFVWSLNGWGERLNYRFFFFTFFKYSTLRSNDFEMEFIS